MVRAYYIGLTKKGFDKLNLDDPIVNNYILKICSHTDKEFIIKTEDIKIDSWNHLWELIDCKRKSTRAKVKNFLLDSDFITVNKVVNKKEFVLNNEYFKVIRD